MKCIIPLLLGAFASTSAGLAGQEPVVLIDAAHHNSVFRGPGRASVIRFLEANGFGTRDLEGPFSEDVLGGVQIALVATALSAQNALPSPFTQEQFDSAWSRPVRSAFSTREIQILRDWVGEGGSLLLVFDHMPLAGAAKDLAAAFELDVSDGYAVDLQKLSDFGPETVTKAASVVFYRSNGTLADHPITSQRGPTGRIDSIATWTGSAIHIPPNASSLLTLGSSFVSLVPDTAWIFSESTPRQDIAGWSQGAVLEVGRGRVAAFAEAGILVSAEMMARDDPNRETNPQIQNPQLLLNVLRWLAGQLSQ